MKRYCGVKEHNDDLGEFDRAQGVRDRKLFELFLHLGLFPHPSRVKNSNRQSLPVERERYGIACDPGLGAGQKSFFIQQLVDQSRFACVRAPNDGNLKRAFDCRLVRRTMSRTILIHINIDGRQYRLY